MDETDSLSRREQASENRLTRVETLLEVLPTMQQQLSELVAASAEQTAEMRGLRRDVDLKVNKGEFEQMSARVADNTASINEMRKQLMEIRTTDFPWFVSLLIAVAAGLAGMMAKGFGWL